MFNEKPKIGVTGPVEGGEAAWLFTKLSVLLAGGKALRITPEEQRDIHDLDALIIGGGADIEPVKYGEERIEKAKLTRNQRTIFEWILSIILFPIYWLGRYFLHTKKSPIDLKRDELEFRLLAEAIEQEKPVLGICRGMQLMNVHFKGSLYQDISGFYGEKAQVSSIFPKKRVKLKEGSKLREILKTNTCNVNALHNQAINNVGVGVEVTAKELNTGIFQAIEHQDYPFMIGVQWHPEYLIQIERQRNIFKTLVREAKEASKITHTSH